MRDDLRSEGWQGTRLASSPRHSDRLFVYLCARSLDMPPRCVNVRASAQEDGTFFALSIPPRRVNIPDEGVDPLYRSYDSSISVDY
ncbi:hypothetical protein PVK06_026490 [Gossypium arboreum]|uniref:Uncharacterized protein n=1 Tax=Gossypium arboreum TaxID=29729 RepID=A0ABR0NXT8_GOSAR|nr:hypothetical protein PVK06_026490 [Gossypium arboreum]